MEKKRMYFTFDIPYDEAVEKRIVAEDETPILSLLPEILKQTDDDTRVAISVHTINEYADDNDRQSYH